MKIKTLALFLLCALLLCACDTGSAVSVQPTAVAPTEQAAEPTASPQTTPQEAKQVVIAAATSEATQAPAVTMPPTPEPTPVPTPEPTATPVPKLGVLDGKFADKFVTGTPVITDMSYQSDTLAIFISKETDKSKEISREPYTYYLADVYFQNMENFRSGFSHTMDFKYKYIERVDVIAKEYNALFAISGDYIRYRDTGVCVRNGVLCRSTPDNERDMGVIYLDGRMETYEAKKAPVEALLADENVWHIIGFGPELLDENGQPKTQFNTKVSGHNPRCAIGYYEPGHYCFLMVEGRSDATAGLRISDLSKLMHSLGCVKAFNLDGGATAAMYFNGKLLNDRGHKPREMHDIFYIPKDIG